MIQFHIKLKEYEFYYEKMKSKKEKESQIGLFIEILNKPLNTLVTLTVPPGDEEEYNHNHTMAWPIFGYIFLMYNFFGEPCKKWLYFLPLFVALQIIF